VLALIVLAALKLGWDVFHPSIELLLAATAFAFALFLHLNPARPTPATQKIAIKSKYREYPWMGKAYDEDARADFVSGQMFGETYNDSRRIVSDRPHVGATSLYVCKIRAQGCDFELKGGNENVQSWSQQTHVSRVSQRGSYARNFWKLKRRCSGTLLQQTSP
jgi:hypothetical protein